MATGKQNPKPCVTKGMGLRMEDIDKLVPKYAGQFAATNGEGEIFAIAATPTEAEREARKQGLEMPVLFRVPESLCAHFFAF